MKRDRIFWLGLLSVCLINLSAGPAAEPVNLLSLHEGTLPIAAPRSYSGWNAEALLDDSSLTGWACEDGHTKNNVFVFELAEAATLDRFEFDTANVDDEGAGAKDLLVEVSATSATSGFTPVLSAALANKGDHQSFTAQKKMSARWVRLTLVNNYGSQGWTELFAFRGFGIKPETSNSVNISGTYESNYARFHLRQQGASLTGCYEFNEGLLSGVIEGRVMKIVWREAGGPDDRGPAVMVFAPDGKSFRGFYWATGNERGAPDGSWSGKKISVKIGSCAHWSGSVGEELNKRPISELGRAQNRRVELVRD